nr:hypothetical protein [Tanacetum cinerariifolium]
MLHVMIEDPYVEVALQAPPSPDYIPSPKEPEQVPPSPDYVPGPEHADDEIAAGRMRQTVISELLRIDHRRSADILELRTALQG